MKKKIANIEVIGVGAGRKIPLRRFAYLFRLHCGRMLDLKKQCRRQTDQAAGAKPCVASANLDGSADAKPCVTSANLDGSGGHPQIKITRKISWKTRRW